jgi:hypothetical protein
MKIAAHARPLLDALVAPRTCLGFDRATWDRLIRSARKARLLGVLAARITTVVALESIDPAVRRHLYAGTVEANYRRQKTLYLLSALAAHLGAPQVPCVLLKGAAYITQGLGLAEGRLPADVDVMVPRSALDTIEQSLLDAGWQFEKTAPYDQRYYRDWSHELPPLSSPGQALELDLHHTILPPLGRLKPDTEALFRSAVRVTGTRFSVLCAADQVLLAAAHLFQDSDCTDRLRDLVDFDGLLRAFAPADPQFWPQLLQRARLHQLERPLWYALRFARAWLQTPVPPDAQASIENLRPPAASSATLCFLAARTLPPVDPDGELTWSRRWASRLLEARATWLRMPPRLVAYHTAHKIAQVVLPQPAPRSAGVNAE